MRRLGPDDDGYELECNDELQQLLARRDLTFVVGGHTHRRMVRRFRDLMVLNAGTIHRWDDPCVLVVDFVRGEARLHDIADERIVGATRVWFG
jgi:predicted phosphodiesterase